MRSRSSRRAAQLLETGTDRPVEVDRIQLNGASHGRSTVRFGSSRPEDHSVRPAVDEVSGTDERVARLDGHVPVLRLGDDPQPVGNVGGHRWQRRGAFGSQVVDQDAIDGPAETGQDSQRERGERDRDDDVRDNDRRRDPRFSEALHGQPRDRSQYGSDERREDDGAAGDHENTDALAQIQHTHEPGSGQCE